jgi:hypothetical protein
VFGKGLIGESRTHVDKAVEGTRVTGVADRRWGITVGGFEGAILDEFNRGYTRSPTRSRIHDQECLASRPSNTSGLTPRSIDHARRSKEHPPLGRLLRLRHGGSRLYWAQAIVVPVALAFLLTPVVTPLQRWLGQVPAVLTITIAAFVVLGLAGWGLTWQVMSVLGEFLAYRENIRQRVRDIRVASRGGAVRTGLLNRHDERQDQQYLLSFCSHDTSIQG